MSEIVGACLSQFHDDENSFELLLAYSDGREVGFSVSRKVAQKMASELANGAGCDPSAVERKAEPVAWQWRNGAPPKPWSDEWFIAETTYGDRVVLRSLPEDWTYDFKTADDTYIKADKIKRWMQFPDSHYIPPPAAPVKGEGWQPIDTAPKGRKLVLLDCENWLNPVIGYFSETIGSWLEYGTRDTKANAATHWVHLPARAALSASPSPVDSRDGLIERLVKTLEPFSEVSGEGDEDFPDETPVTVKFGRTLDLTLTLGAFREARAVLAAKEQQP